MYIAADRGGSKICTYSSLLIPFRSFKSAPAQKLASTSLARINARVGPSPSFSAWMLSTSCRSSLSSCREMALRDSGRLRLRIRMLPLWGAGTLVTLIVEAEAVEYALREVFHWRSERLCLWRHWFGYRIGGRMVVERRKHRDDGDSSLKPGSSKLVIAEEYRGGLGPRIAVM